MSILKTYNRTPDVFGDPELGSGWPLYRLNDDLTVDKDLRDFRPGDFVCHVNGGGTGRGIVVAVNDTEIAVLWSTCPQEVDFSKFNFPVVKKAPPGGLFQQTNFRIQPMSVPSGAIFYMDYQYGKDEREETPAAPVPVQRPPKNPSRSPGRPGRPTRGPRKNP